jgi:hypothetical protein
LFDGCSGARRVIQQVAIMTATTIAEAIAVLDRLTLADLDRADPETVRRLRDLAHHWSELAAMRLDDAASRSR